MFVIPACLLVFTGIVFAQTTERFQEGFGVSPLRLSLEGRPGSRVQGKFTIIAQNTKQRTRYGIRIADIAQRGDPSVSPAPPGQGARSCAEWITVSDQVEVEPNGRETVPFIIAVPQNTLGAYYAFLIVEFSPEMPAAKFAAVLKPSLAVQIELTIPGSAPLHIDVTEFSIQPGIAGATPDIMFKASNTGVWKSSVEGDVLLYGKPGTWPIRTSIPYRRGGNAVEIYPGMAVDFRCPLPHSVTAGPYKALVRLLLNGKIEARSWFELEVAAKEGDTTSVGDLVEKSELDVPLYIEPDLVEVSTPPGARRTVAIKIQNQGDREAKIQVEVGDVRIEQNGMFTFSELVESSDNGWVTASPEILTLPPRRRSVVKAQVVVPRNRPGNATIVKAVRIRATAAATKYHDDWSSGGDFPVIIVAQDPKAAPAGLAAIGFEVVRPSPGLNPSAAVLRVKNTGGRVARAHGRILLERANGQEIARMDIGASQSEFILPGSEREFRMPFPPLDRGKFRIRAEISPGGKGSKMLHAEEVFTAQAATPEGLR